MKQLLMRLGGLLFCSLCLFAALANVAFAADVSPSIVAGDFPSLKAALENPERDTTVTVPGGEYIATEPITIDKDLTLKNAAGQKVTIKLGFFNTDAYKLGESLFNVTTGTTTFDGDADGNLIIDGGSNFSFEYKPLDSSQVDIDNTNVTGKGVLLTAGNGLDGYDSANIIINHAIFQNVANAGGLSAAVFIGRGSSLTLNSGAIRHNYANMQQTTANSDYFSIGDTKNNPDNPLHTQYPNVTPGARSAGVFLINASLTQNGGEISDNYLSIGQGAAIHSVATSGRQRSSITMNGGVIDHNYTQDWPGDMDSAKGSSAYGGAIFLNANSDFTMTDGTFSNNYSNGAGGAIFAMWTTRVNISGGSFEGNRAERMGGAIATADFFIVYNFNEKENEINSGDTNPYNITSITDWYNYGFGVKLKIDGGTFKSNSSHIGGAIYIASDKAEINGGVFDGNEAHRFGGALYLASQPYTMKIRNAYVANNTAVADGVTDLGNTLYPEMLSLFHTGSGGGVWYCPTGTGSLFVSNGVAIFDNTADNEADDFTSMKKEKVEYKVSVANRTLGGGYTALYNDSMGNRATSSTPELDPVKDSSEDIMIKTELDPRAKETAKALAKTVFINNKAKRGGAIATNGHVDFGDDNLTFTLNVAKQWDETVKPTDRKEAVAELYIVTTNAQTGEEELNYVDSVKLNAENQYAASFSDLPLENFGKTEYRVIEKGDDYDVSYSLTRPDTTGTTETVTEASNSFNTKDLQNGDEVAVTLTNRSYFKVNYQFVSDDSKYSIPDEVNAVLPETLTKQKIGTTVAPAALTAQSVATDTGIWTFVSWDKTEATIKDADAVFTGTWHFEPYQRKVNYTFVSGTEGKDLPEEVKALLPTSTEGHLVGDVVEALIPLKTSVTTAEGTWTFVGWDSPKKTVGAEDVTFVGTWTFKQKDIHLDPVPETKEPQTKDSEPEPKGDESKIPNTGDSFDFSAVAALVALSGFIAAAGLGNKLRRYRF